MLCHVPEDELVSDFDAAALDPKEKVDAEEMAGAAFSAAVDKGANPVDPDPKVGGLAVLDGLAPEAPPKNAPSSFGCCSALDFFSGLLDFAATSAGSLSSRVSKLPYLLLRSSKCVLKTNICNYVQY